MFNLNDIRYFLAVAESGSLSAASRRLGVTQPTVGRRINDIERALGARLFDRSLRGYEMTDAGARILDSAKTIETHAWGIVNRIGGESDLHLGRVRLTVPEGFGIRCLVPVLPLFHQLHRNIHLDVYVHNSFVDVLRRQADVAIRIGKPGSELLVGRILSEISIGLYASAEYCAAHGTPETLQDLAAHTVIAPSGELGNTKQSKLLDSVMQENSHRLRTNNIIAQLGYAERGLGIAPLPSYLISDDVPLQRVLAMDFDLKVPLWMVTHHELRDNEHVRNVREFLTNLLTASASVSNTAPGEQIGIRT